MSEFKLSQLTVPELEDLLGAKALEVEQAYQAKHKAQSDYFQLDAFSKAIWAQNFPPKGTGGSVEDRKAEAEQSLPYQEHCTALSDANRARREVEAKADSAMVKWETVKTVLMKRYIHAT